jgi:hypothetical protein
MLLFRLIPCLLSGVLDDIPFKVVKCPCFGEYPPDCWPCPSKLLVMPIGVSLGLPLLGAETFCSMLKALLCAIVALVLITGIYG